jgi:hypothetical protein
MADPMKPHKNVKSHSRTNGELRKDRIDIAKLYVQGYGPTYIAHWMSENRSYSLSVATISRDIAVVKREWREQYLPDIDAMKAVELARLDSLIQEAWAGWYASRKTKETSETEQMTQETKAKTGSVAKPIYYEETKSKLKQEQRDGDYRFLEMIDKCINRRCRILGLEAPSRHEIKDWRQEAEKAGINASEIFETMVNAAVDAEEIDEPTRNDEPEDE